MFRIDSSGNIAGRFNDNLLIGNPATRVTADFLNDVQENLCGAIEGADIVLSKGDFTQLLAAIKKLARENGVPVGTPLLSDGPNCPPGYVEFDHEYLQADYPDLVWFYANQGRLIPGSTAAHFRTPVVQGRFIRIAATDNTVDPDGPRAAGSLQADEIRSHDHSIPSQDNANAGDGYVEDANTVGTSRNTRTGATGGAETRGVNVAWFVFIKA